MRMQQAAEAMGRSGVAVWSCSALCLRKSFVAVTENTFSVASRTSTRPSGLRQLGWQLAGTGQRGQRGDLKAGLAAVSFPSCLEDGCAKLQLLHFPYKSGKKTVLIILHLFFQEI